MLTSYISNHLLTSDQMHVMNHWVHNHKGTAYQQELEHGALIPFTLTGQPRVSSAIASPQPNSVAPPLLLHLILPAAE